MIDFGVSKMALVAAVALIVLGPEKLPQVARTLGFYLGKIQRYIANVKAEMANSIALDELRQLKTGFENAANQVHSSIENSYNQSMTAVSEFDASMPQNTMFDDNRQIHQSIGSPIDNPSLNYPTHSPVTKKWRVKRTAIPHWYKLHTGHKRKALSAAARVAKYKV